MLATRQDPSYVAHNKLWSVVFPATTNEWGYTPSALLFKPRLLYKVTQVAKEKNFEDLFEVEYTLYSNIYQLLPSHIH